jgi:hypothetical protein
MISTEKRWVSVIEKALIQTMRKKYEGPWKRANRNVRPLMFDPTTHGIQDQVEAEMICTATEHLRRMSRTPAYYHKCRPLNPTGNGELHRCFQNMSPNKRRPSFSFPAWKPLEEAQRKKESELMNVENVRRPTQGRTASSEIDSLWQNQSEQNSSKQRTTDASHKTVDKWIQWMRFGMLLSAYSHCYRVKKFGVNFWFRDTDKWKCEPCLLTKKLLLPVYPPKLTK